MFAPECLDYLNLSLLESDNINKNSRTFRNSVTVKRYLPKITILHRARKHSALKNYSNT